MKTLQISIEEKELIKELNLILNETNQLFSHYQSLPKIFLDKYNKFLSKNYVADQISLDKQRLDFLKQNLNIDNINITECGSNLGYFCLSLSNQNTKKIIGYEPINNYAHASNIISKLLGVHKNVFFHGRGIDLSDIEKLEPSDLYIELNVLHHAGSQYDNYYINNSTFTRSYFIVL